MSKVTILDGGMGQELLARSGAKPTPLWSAQVMLDHPEIVEAVHRDYVEAGADVITLNTYSATPERLARDANVDLLEPLHATAIKVAKNAKKEAPVKFAGCISPLFGSYHPEMAPDYETCLATYRRVVALQKEAADLFLCETLSSVKEVKSAVTAAKESGKPVWCSMSVSESDGSILRSGESLEEGVAAAVKAGADAVLLNCSPPEAITQGLKILAKSGLPFGAYANGFTKADDLELGGTVDVLEARTDLDPKAYADFCQKWVDMGATIIGGCCEVGPAHIAELKRRFG